MSPEEAVEMFENAGMLSEDLTEVKIKKFFLWSMMDVKNEMTTKKHMQMIFVEFLELLARCINFLSEGSSIADGALDAKLVIYLDKILGLLGKKKTRTIGKFAAVAKGIGRFAMLAKEKKK
eukprot:TRINITY_DN3852_c0_g1_i2.p1 TRINITY_DN3852_c0_g1~~TRINITY_DN3852_c0_g1_i2.p1  ORF type:complete len:121 (-),score=49.74 TRINITY_DN3852_c0_g1_i2:444-806(-)